jgi:HSP20 family protein
MNMYTMRALRPLIIVALLALLGAVGVQAYYTHELVRELAAAESRLSQAPVSAPVPGQSGPWSVMNVEMSRARADLDGGIGLPFPGLYTVGTVVPVGEDEFALKDQGDKYVVTADIPGAKEGDIQVNLDGRVLSISSQTQGTEKQTADNGRVLDREHYSSAFEQAFTLPGPVDHSGMHTQFKDGVLTVTIPKATS